MAIHHDEIVLEIKSGDPVMENLNTLFDIYDPTTYIVGHAHKAEEVPSRFRESFFEELEGVKYDDIPNQTNEAAAAWKEAHPEEQALRFNTNKSQLSSMLEADVAMKGMCKVFEFGAEKYARSNWKKGLPVDEIIDSLLRHLMSVANGEVIDPESKLPHIDHITCNAVFLATFGNRDDS